MCVCVFAQYCCTRIIRVVYVISVLFAHSPLADKYKQNYLKNKNIEMIFAPKKVKAAHEIHAE